MGTGISQLNPSKRRGNRRYYQRKDVLMVREIMSLLYEQGFTIDGARLKLSNETNTENNRVFHYLVHETINSLETIITELEQ